VPANRLGFGQFSGIQLKMIQEVVTLVAFKDTTKIDHRWSFSGQT
jgi:uncharacterized protein (DUF486 family)